jgi:hypothetical protein
MRSSTLRPRNRSRTFYGRRGPSGPDDASGGSDRSPRHDDPRRASRRWAERRFTDIRHWNKLDRGGHFAAYDQPALFGEEVRAVFRHVRRATPRGRGRDAAAG